MNVIQAAELLEKLRKVEFQLRQISKATEVEDLRRVGFRSPGERVDLSDIIRADVGVDEEKLAAALMSTVVEALRAEIDRLRLLLIHLGVQIDPPTHRPPPPPEKN